jgi:hypothetical protein
MRMFFPLLLASCASMPSKAEDKPVPGSPSWPAPGSSVPPAINLDAEKAIAMLNEVRVKFLARPVTLSPVLSARCSSWAGYVANVGHLEHDAGILGSQEREVLAMMSGGEMTAQTAFNTWTSRNDYLPPLIDQQGWPQAVRAGYAQVANVACLRICPDTQFEFGICPKD